MTKSACYLYQYKEIPTDPLTLVYLPAKEPSDWLLTDLRTQLIERMWELAPATLTKAQYEIMVYLYKELRTQKETAEKINRCQTYVNFVIFGVPQYKENSVIDTKRKKLGGVVNKLRKVMSKDAITQEILRQIAELD